MMVMPSSCGIVTDFAVRSYLIMTVFRIPDGPALKLSTAIVI